MRKLLLTFVILLSPAVAFAQSAALGSVRIVSTNGVTSAGVAAGATSGGAGAAAGAGVYNITGQYLTALPTLTTGQMTYLQTDSSGRLLMAQPTAGAFLATDNIAQINGNTALTGNGATGTGSLRVTIASDNTAFNVTSNSANIATESSLAKLTIAQGTALGSNTVALMAGSVTTAAPTYTTGQISPLSLDTTGALRTSTTTSGQAAVFAAQQAVTATAVALGTNSSKNVCVKSLSASTQLIYVGPTGVTTSGATGGHELGPGDTYCAPVSNSNLLYVIAGSTGGTVDYIGTN